MCGSSDCKLKHAVAVGVAAGGLSALYAGGLPPRVFAVTAGAAALAVLLNGYIMKQDSSVMSEETGYAVDTVPIFEYGVDGLLAGALMYGYAPAAGFGWPIVAATAGGALLVQLVTAKQ